MELKPFIGKLYSSKALHALLPIHQGMLYPCFTVCNQRLCVHFLTNASQITSEGLLNYPPEYHVISLYPEGGIRCIRDLKYDPNFQNVDFEHAVLQPRMAPDQQADARERIKKLEILADNALCRWTETGSADFSEYHCLLRSVLTEQQAQMYRIVMGCE